MRRVGLSLLLVILAGCGSVYRIDDPFVDRAPGKGQSADPLWQLNLDNYKFPEDRNKADSQTAYVRASTDESGVARDRLQMDLMSASDKHCTMHKSEALATFNNVNLLTSIAAAGLSGAAAVAKGSIAKHLAAGAGFMQATKAEANADIYRQSLVEAVLKALDNEQQRQEAIIRPKRGKKLADYSTDEAIRDSFRYADSCSFYQGVKLLTEAVNKNDPCKVLRDRQAVLAAELAKTLPTVVQTANQEEFNRNNTELASCTGRQ